MDGGKLDCMQRLPIFAIALVLFATTFASAQDTRTVKEPTIPPTCTTLTAHLSTSGSDIAQSDEPAQDKEPALDTTRIQQALDTCAKGKAVVLRADGANDAFLTGPLQLRQNVTLVIAKGTTLFGSRNPAAYETAPGSCGIITPPAHPMDSVPLTGCKPLISADHVSGAGIMGDGVIDGRGGEKMLGKDLTWWGLAEKTRPGYGHQVSRIIEAQQRRQLHPLPHHP